MSKIWLKVQKSLVELAHLISPPTFLPWKTLHKVYFNFVHHDGYSVVSLIYRNFYFFNNKKKISFEFFFNIWCQSRLHTDDGTHLSLKKITILEETE